MSFQMRSLMPSSMRSGATTTKQQGGLPVSQTHSKQQQQQQQQEQGLRRRLSSLSLKIQPSPEAADATYSWVLRRSKSVSSMGEYAGSSIRKWWDWGCGWILSRKPTFARDLEMNEQETAVLGCHSKGSWRHVFYKLRKLLVRPHHNLPQTFSLEEKLCNLEDENHVLHQKALSSPKGIRPGFVKPFLEKFMSKRSFYLMEPFSLVVKQLQSSISELGMHQLIIPQN